ncbi:MAG: DUF4443 domain-containing protein [Candidatus Hermodarchaeia archaeon]|jgi:predicted transcriptional regulator
MKLTRLLNPEARQGPPTQFHPWHLLTAFHTFCQNTSPIGRYQLGANLALGNGSIRSLIRFLRNQELIEPVSRQGHQLTTGGKQYCEDLTQILVKTEELPQSSYTIDSYNFGCHLRQLAHLVTDGVEQRDAAKQAGASGATTFIQDSDPDTLIMVKDHRIQKQAMTNILAPFEITTNDVLIVGSSSNSISAQLGAFAALLTLLKKL